MTPSHEPSTLGRPRPRPPGSKKRVGQALESTGGKMTSLPAASSFSVKGKMKDKRKDPMVTLDDSNDGNLDEIEDADMADGDADEQDDNDNGAAIQSQQKERVRKQRKRRRHEENAADEGEDEDEECQGIPSSLVTRLLHEFFKKEETRVTKDANEAVVKYMDVFVREAIARAAQESKGGFLEVEDLEKIAPQLLFDL